MHRPGGRSTITTTTTRSGTGRPTETQRTVHHEPAFERSTFEPSYHRAFSGIPRRTNMDDVMFDAVLDGGYGSRSGFPERQSRRTTETTFGSQPDEMMTHRSMIDRDGFGIRGADDGFSTSPRRMEMRQPQWRIPDRQVYEPMVRETMTRHHFGGSSMADTPTSGGDVIDNDTEFAVRLPTLGYKPDELKVELTDDLLTISGVHEEKAADGSTSQKQFKRSYKLSPDADVEKLGSELSPDGAVLTVRAPKKRSAIQNDQQPIPIKVQVNKKETTKPVQEEKKQEEPKPMRHEDTKPAKKEEPKKQPVQGAPNGLPEIEVCEYD